MIITVKNVDVDVAKTDRNNKPYSAAEVMYVDDRGQAKMKAFHSQYDPFYKTVCGLEAGVLYDVTTNKNDKGFLDWIAIKKSEGASASPSGPPSTLGTKSNVSKDTYNENKDAAIRRAVCLKAAIELVAATATGKSDPAKLAADAVTISPIFEPYLRGDATDKDIDDIVKEM